MSTIGADPWENEFEAGNTSPFQMTSVEVGSWPLQAKTTPLPVTTIVFMAQLTTDGVISGQFTAQIFPVDMSLEGTSFLSSPSCSALWERSLAHHRRGA